MSEQHATQQVVCPACGSECLAISKSCWLCQANLKDAQPIITATIVQSSTDSSIGNQLFTWLTIACVCFALLIGIGIVQSDAGMIVPYLILIVPAFVATGGRAVWARARGKKLSGSQLFLTFASSVGLIVGLMGMLIVGAVAALFIACLSLGPMRFQ